jgi:hypothetical protein
MVDGARILNSKRPRHEVDTIEERYNYRTLEGMDNRSLAILGILYVSMMLFAGTCGGLSSPASRRRLGNVQTSVEFGIDIVGKQLFDRA